ncbi:MAG: hypothetical protein BGO89_06280 [Candidatus Kapaibacterium thiocyanatum]|uniref:Uncharacterized protein n=1 Tax=Candidatus Kapaibacterium thiocyanatum TaxID=1895771 RepID=A0A1M3L2S4_9BACT|nr:MAG: hypothetical protein BGO89_06280 ['Candidatus Kapabacteria' thiocyanatum]
MIDPIHGRGADHALLSRIATLVLCLGVMLSFTSGVRAQSQESCEENCPGVPFTTQTITYSPLPSCSFTITVKKRFCVSWELVIQSITRTGSCGGLSPAEIVNLVTSDIVMNNMMNFPPAGGYTYGGWVWRIVRPSCWKFSGLSVVPCDSSQCCISYINVEKRIECPPGHWEAASERQVLQVLPCAPNVTSGPMLGCMESCGPITPWLKAKMK